MDLGWGFLETKLLRLHLDLEVVINLRGFYKDCTSVPSLRGQISLQSTVFYHTGNSNTYSSVGSLQVFCLGYPFTLSLGERSVEGMWFLSHPSETGFYFTYIHVLR